LNNANLALFRQYNQHIPAFRQMVRSHDYDFKAFYEEVRQLAAHPKDERDRILAKAGGGIMIRALLNRNN